jgi:catechol 2,3-dioxygenase-like lactoylglutathione lyase family enzyme
MGQRIRASHLDHIVLTVHDIDASVAFYQSILGMEKIDFADGRIALAFGTQKINLHQAGAEFEPKAENVQVGSADLCFIIEETIEDARQNCLFYGVDIIGASD